MSRPLRVVGYIGIGVMSGLLVAMMAIFLITRTEWGMDRARRFAVAWLAERIHGELRVGRLTGPGLLSGVTIHDFAITDSIGRGFVRADSLELEYNWRTLLSGRIELNRVVMHQPYLELEQLPGDSIWNYEHIFADTTPSKAEPGRSLILFRNARVYNGTVVLRTPLEPVADIAPEDTARVILEQVPGGTVRVIRFEQINAELSRVIWETPVEPGQLFEVASVSARGFVQREPFVLQNARGTVTARDTVIAIDMHDVTMPGSQADILGTVVQREGKNILDFRVEGRRFAFRDLQWLYPRLPDEGGGSVLLRIQSRPDGTLFLAEDARIQTPGTQLAGTVGIVTGDSLYFTRVNLRASPLDVRLLEQLLPGGLPVEGLLIGTVEVRGPISALETSGDVRVAEGVGAGSEIEWSGVLDLRSRDVAARSLRANVKNLELALITALNPRVKLDGRVSGAVQGSGDLQQLLFNASLTHSGRGGAQTSFTAGGAVRRDGDTHSIEISGDATSATFRDLAEYIPALKDLRGEVRGPVRLEGNPRDLRFDARLTTDGGPIQLSGRVLDAAGARRVVGQARGEAFQLSALRADLPEVVVTGTATFDITGSDIASAHGTAQLVLDSARVRDLPLRYTVIGGRLADGLFAVDSARSDARGGAARARGTVALVEGRQGSLEFGFSSESLSPFERFLLGAPDTLPDAEPRLAGKLEATGTVTGWIGALDVSATARGEELVYDRATAARASAELELRGLRGGAPVPLRFTAFGDSVRVYSHPLQSARLEATGAVDSIHIAAAAQSTRSELVHVRADVLRPEPDFTTVRVAELRVGGGSPWELSGPASVTMQHGRIHVAGAELRRAAGGLITAIGTLAWANSPAEGALPLDFGVSVEGVPFTELLRARRSTAEGAGMFDGTLRISGTALDPIVEGELNGRNLRYDDVRIDHAFAELNYSALGLDAHAEAQYDGRSILTGGGRIPIDLRFTGVGERRLDEPLRFTIAADSLPPGLPLGLVDGFTRTQGRIDGTVAISGTTLDPALRGGFTIGNGGFDWDVTGVRYRDVDGAFTLERGRVLRVNLTAQATDPSVRLLGSAGSGSINGTIELTALTNPRFDLRLIADRVFAARRRDVEATVTGELRLAGQYRRPELSGSIRVDEGALYLDEVYRQYLIVSLDSISAVDTSLVAMTPVLGAVIARNPFLTNMRVDSLQLRVGSNTWLRSAEMDVEVTGDLRVEMDRARKELLLSGLLNVARGTYTLYYPPFQSRRFNVRQGTIEFPGIPGIDPNLSISAAYRARNTQREPLDVLAVVSGSLQNPRVRLTSEAQPPISESDLASYLFFGVPSWQVANNGVASGDVSAVRNFGLQAITPSVLGYASSGLQTLAQTVGVDYAALTAAEISPERRAAAGALANFIASTQLEVGTYVEVGSSAFYLAASKWLGSSNLDPAVRVEWRFLPEYTFELFTDQRFAGSPGFGIRPEAEPKRVFGFFLFREWGF